MNRLEFLDKLRMVYCGDKNAFDDISAEQERLSIIEEKYKDCTQYYVNGFKEEIDRLNNLNKQLVEECQRLDDEETRLNNIINELEWKPIEQYKKPKYDWVLVKYFIEPNFECVPCVAEKRFGKWYDINDNLINGEVRYFFDMQQLDKLKELKENK